MFLSVGNQNPDEDGATAVARFDSEAAFIIVKKLNGQPLTEDEAEIADDFSEELHSIAIAMDYREGGK